MEPKQKEKNKVFLEGFDILVFAVVFVMLVLTFFVRTARVNGPSMNTTLTNGDQVIVYSFFYTPKHGDIVAIDSYTSYGKPLMKRVIAIGGDEINIDETGNVYLNGTLMKEEYASSLTQQGDVSFPLIIPEGKVFVMGDNRSDSLDSRSSSIGLIDEREILGKVVLRILPTNKFGEV